MFKANALQSDDQPYPARRKPEIGASAREIPARNVCLATALCLLAGCTPKETRPVDIFPEDMCAYCKMAVSDQRVASEIITVSGEVFKFDDLGCLESYEGAHRDVEIAAAFVKEYDTKAWLRWQDAVIVETGLFTPMGSGKIAVRDSSRANSLARD